MKNLILILTFLFLPFLYVTAQEAAYTKAMTAALAQMEKATTAEELTASANTFSRISEAMPKEGLPVYYKSLARLNSASQKPNGKEKDKELENVLADIALLLNQQPGDSELLTLKGYQHILYLSADPASRGQMWSAKAIQVLQQALDANPQNPRANLLMGQMQWGMAQFMNSGTEQACSLFDKAVELYGAEAGKENKLSPSWGADTALHMQAQCQSAQLK